ncbi:anti-sigma factor [Bacillus circulans]|uniref:anti-sigma factor n=1 Tax=Niallia circulans TaxID=1397 RepID=UPI00156006EE|nr:anti-sigma factor [Niallia circulans]NRG26820.1 anti-sigma factor [Niallia circulans]
MKKDEFKEEEEKDYLNKIQEAIDEFEAETPFTDKDQQLIVRRGKVEARLTNILYSLTILLLIIPVATLGSYLYYGIGNKANDFIDIMEKTIYITKPNVSLEEMEIDSKIGFFNMDLSYDLYKRVGKKDVRIGDSKAHFTFSTPSFPDTSFITEKPFTEYRDEDKEVLFHPHRAIPYMVKQDETVLKGLPGGTVAEAFVSFDQLYTEKELFSEFPKDLDLVWFAVDTGLEEKNLSADGDYISPIGYPAQEDPDNWSPFNSDEINSKQFMEILTYLSKNQETAETIAERPLALPERIEYLQKNGIHIYGAVVTGPKESLVKLQDNDMVKGMKLGEVRLWNWY